jgi:hypothetical protein
MPYRRRIFQFEKRNMSAFTTYVHYYRRFAFVIAISIFFFFYLLLLFLLMVFQVPPNVGVPRLHLPSNRQEGASGSEHLREAIQRVCSIQCKLNIYVE